MHTSKCGCAVNYCTRILTSFPTSRQFCNNTYSYRLLDTSCVPNCVYTLFSLVFRAILKDKFIVLILQMKNRGLSWTEQPGQDYTAREWQNWDLNPDTLDSSPLPRCRIPHWLAAVRLSFCPPGRHKNDARVFYVAQSKEANKYRKDIQSRMG